MESKFDLLLSFLLDDDAKKGEKALVTKFGPELKSFSDDREGGGGDGNGKGKAVATKPTAAVQQASTAGWIFKGGRWIFLRVKVKDNIKS